MSHIRSTTRSTVRRLALPLALVATLTLGACGTENDDKATDDTSSETAQLANSVEIADPWVRATTGAEDTTMTAAFMGIDNTGDQEVTIVAATSPTTMMVELHEMVMVDGKSMMQEIDGGIVLEPGRGQLLQPGGLHIMLMGLEDELAPGDEVELTLELSDGSTVDVTAPVKEFTEETEHYHAPGTDKEHSH
jgi:copper(I)-binding protein